MFSKIVKGKDLAQLESEVNKFLTDHQMLVVQNNENKPDELRRLKIYNVQQFVIGEVDPKTVNIIRQQPVPTYSFCLLIICGYE